MLLLTCPNCGTRNISEFRFGGESHPRPREPMQTTDAEWNDYLYLRENKQGVQTEWWYHRAGCGLWFLAERNTYTNQVLKTYIWQSTNESGATEVADPTRGSESSPAGQHAEPPAV